MINALDMATKALIIALHLVEQPNFRAQHIMIPSTELHQTFDNNDIHDWRANVWLNYIGAFSLLLVLYKFILFLIIGIVQFSDWLFMDLVLMRYPCSSRAEKNLDEYHENI